MRALVPGRPGSKKHTLAWFELEPFTSVWSFVRILQALLQSFAAIKRLHGPFFTLRCVVQYQMKNVVALGLKQHAVVAFNGQFPVQYLSYG